MSKTKRALSKREYILLGVTAVVLLFGFVKYWYMPKNKQIAELKLKIQTSETEKKMLQQTIALSKQRIVASAGGGSGAHPLKKYIDQNAMLANLVKTLSTTEKDEVFKIKRMTADPPALFKAYQKSLFTLDVETSYMSIGSFLEHLEESTLLTEVHSVEMSRVSEDLRKVNAKIKLSGYFSRE